LLGLPGGWLGYQVFVAGFGDKLAAQDLPSLLLKSYNSCRRREPREIHNKDCPGLPGIPSSLEEPWDFAWSYAMAVPIMVSIIFSLFFRDNLVADMALTFRSLAGNHRASSDVDND